MDLKKMEINNLRPFSFMNYNCSCNFNFFLSNYSRYLAFLLKNGSLMSDN